MMVMVMVVVMVGLFLYLPLEIKKIIDGTWQLQRSLGVVAVDLISLVQQLLEKWMVKVRYRNHKSLKTLLFILLF